MTRLGTDISSYQSGLRLKDLAFADFVIAKCSQGIGWTDADYPGWRDEAAAIGKPFGWYHFLETSDATAQVAHTKACVGDRTLPGMLDVEPYGTSKPGIDNVLAYADAALSAGLNLRLVYWPHWYWQECGSPSLLPLAARGLHLVSSSYPGGTGTPAQLYPGDSASGFDAYGGMTPGMYQFTDKASDDGFLLDYNAIREDSVFHAVFGGDIVTPQDIQAIAAAVYQFGKEDVNTPTGVMHNVPLGNLAHGAWVSVNDPEGPVMKMLAQILAAVLALNPKALGPAIAAAIDIPSLASAIAAHMTANPGADEQSIAVAVAGYFAQKLGTP